MSDHACMARTPEETRKTRMQWSAVAFILVAGFGISKEFSPPVQPTDFSKITTTTTTKPLPCNPDYEDCSPADPQYWGH